MWCNNEARQSLAIVSAGRRHAELLRKCWARSSDSLRNGASDRRMMQTAFAIQPHPGEMTTWRPAIKPLYLAGADESSINAKVIKSPST
jgi:hypothetical protein